MLLPPVIFEDDALIAFDKPCNGDVSESDAKKSEELMPQIRARYGESVTNVHRLDADTSGIFLCAKTKPALDFLSGQFQSKTADKKYLALAVLLPVEQAVKSLAALRSANGIPTEPFIIDVPLRADEHVRNRMRVGKGGGAKESVTEVHILERFGRFLWLQCRPVTSRLHQVRVHLSALGTPVLNDAIYGDPEAKLLLSDLKRGYKGRDEERPMLTRLALHASALTIKHPVSHESLILVAPLPHEFEVALKYLRKFSK